MAELCSESQTLKITNERNTSLCCLLIPATLFYSLKKKLIRCALEKTSQNFSDPSRSCVEVMKYKSNL